MDLFAKKFGIVIACDVPDLDSLKNLVKNTCVVNRVVGYKVGALLTVQYGLIATLEAISELTTLPVLYDHQKFGTDIPDFCGGQILSVIKSTGISALIVFPQSGPETLKACTLGKQNDQRVLGCFKVGLEPIVGAAMTHPKYLESEGGYIADKSVEMIFNEAASYGVEYFVLPSTKMELTAKYCDLIATLVKKPKFLFPGIGKSAQGGDIFSAFQCAKGNPSYAIIGREIYSAFNIKESAQKVAGIIDSLGN